MNHLTPTPPLTRRAGGKIMEFLLPLAVLVAWVVIQAWVLPRFGVKT